MMPSSMGHYPQGTLTIVVFMESALASGSTGKVVRTCVPSPSSLESCSRSGGNDEDVIWMCRSPLSAVCDGGIETSIPAILPPEKIPSD